MRRVSLAPDTFARSSSSPDTFVFLSSSISDILKRSNLERCEGTVADVSNFTGIGHYMVYS